MGLTVVGGPGGGCLPVIEDHSARACPIPTTSGPPGPEAGDSIRHRPSADRMRDAVAATRCRRPVPHHERARGRQGVRRRLQRGLSREQDGSRAVIARVPERGKECPALQAPAPDDGRGRPLHESAGPGSVRGRGGTDDRSPASARPSARQNASGIAELVSRVRDVPSERSRKHTLDRVEERDEGSSWIDAGRCMEYRETRQAREPAPNHFTASNGCHNREVYQE